MTRLIPLTEWYPAMARKWATSPRRYTVPLSERRGWTWHHFAFNATSLDRIRRVADDHYNRWQRPGGYNYCIWQGDVLEMCGRDHVGAHAPGGNRSTLGVAFPFDLSRIKPPQDYLYVAGWLMSQHRIPSGQWPHSHWSLTACPGNGGRSVIPISATPIPQTKDWFTMATEAQLRKVVREEIERATGGRKIGDDTRRIRMALRTIAALRFGLPTQYDDVPERVDT